MDRRELLKALCGAVVAPAALASALPKVQEADMARTMPKVQEFEPQHVSAGDEECVVYMDGTPIFKVSRVVELRRDIEEGPPADDGFRIFRPGDEGTVEMQGTLLSAGVGRVRELMQGAPANWIHLAMSGWPVDWQAWIVGYQMRTEPRSHDILRLRVLFQSP